MNVKISIDDGNGKKAELELSSVSQFNQMFIIQGVFELFGVDTSFLEKEEKMSKIEKAYAKFFDTVDPIESESDKSKLHSNISEKMIEDYTVNENTIIDTYQEKTDSIPEHYITGIKIKDGRETYQLRYVCNVCFFKLTMYVYPNAKSIGCKQCRNRLEVHPATDKPFPSRDNHGNYFRAGVYIDRNLS